MRRILRAVWTRPAAPDPPRRVWRDWVVLAVLAPLAILEAVLRADLVWPLVSAAATLALLPALLWRRTHPLATVVIVTGASTALEVAQALAGFVPVGLGASLGFALLPYVLARWGSGRDVVIGETALVASAVVSWWAHAWSIEVIVGAVVVLGILFLVGELVRGRADARRRELEQARLREREALARDMHDTVAHHVSAIVVQAQAARATGRYDAPLRAIESEAAAALAEMRQLVGALRGVGAETAPTPGLADLRALTSDGPPRVEVEVGDDPVPLAAAATLYRLAQEAVTNARRHARGASHVLVRVETGAGAVRLVVHDDGTPADPPGAGYGLRGMAERVALLGGTCTAGPDPLGGWTVDATLPLAVAETTAP